MIHLKLITQFAETKPDALAFKDKTCGMTWMNFRNETERKILFLLSHYGKNLPQQASYIAKNRMGLMPWLSALTTLGIPVTGIDYSLPLATQKALLLALNVDLTLLSTSLLMQSDDVTSLVPPKAMVFDLDSITTQCINGNLDGHKTDVLGVIEAAFITPRAFRSVGFTSGTTSLPKPVLRHSSFDQRRFQYFSERYSFSSADKFLLGMPVYHAAGNGWARLFLSLGASVYLSDSAMPNDLAFALKQENITATVMTPIMLESVLNVTEQLEAPAAPMLKWLLVGGKHFPVPLKMRALSELGSCLYEYYGTTETGVNTIAEPEDIRIQPASVGKAYSGNTITIVDQNGQEQPPMCAGSVAVNSYMNMASYGDGSTPAIQLDGQTFLVTPDQGYLDKEGRLYLLNRSACAGNHDDLYGFEDAIRRLPGVKDVALVQGYDGTDSVACVLTLEHPDAVHHETIIRIHSLARHEAIALKRCEVVARIPYSPSGKVRVADLTSMLTCAVAPKLEEALN